MYQVYLRYISGISKAYLKHISGKYQANLGFIPGLSQVYVRYISGISQAYIGGTSDLMAKTKIKDENDNLSALITRIIIRKTKERNFEFVFDHLQNGRGRCEM